MYMYVNKWTQNCVFKPGVVVYTINPSTEEAEVSRSL